MSAAPVGPAPVRISTTSGSLRVVAGPRGNDIDVDVDVEGDATVVATSSGTTVEGETGRLVVRVTPGADLVVGTTSGRVEISGSVGSVAVVTESGQVAIDEARAVDVRVATGRVEVGPVATRARVRSGSGAVRIASAGEADVATGSGRMDLPAIAGPVRAHCVSGVISLGLARAADVEAESVSGRIAIRLPEGVRALLVDGDLPDGPLPVGTDCVVATRTVSGRITVSSG